jgi:hypothetical protein
MAVFDEADKGIEPHGVVGIQAPRPQPPSLVARVRERAAAIIWMSV